ncbi:MAG: glycosyltransferase [Planctomycetota bacterium]
MRILQVVHGFPPEVAGGTERYVELITRELAARGHELSVIAGSIDWSERLTVDTTQHAGVPVTRIHRNDLYFDFWDKSYHPRVEAIYEQLLRDAQPEVVHVHHWVRLTSTLARTAARLGSAVVATLHDLYVTCPRVFRVRDQDLLCDEPMGVRACVPCVPRWRFQSDAEIEDSVRFYMDEVRREIEAVRLCFAPSQSHADTLLRFQPALSGKLRVLPHPRTSALVAAAPRARGARLCIGAWSHLTPLKGVHVLLEAVRRAQHADQLDVHILGESFLPDYQRRLDQLAAGLHVTFHGKYQPHQLADLGLDLAVIPTLARESYSFILDEAAELGLPILSADGGALRERATERVLLFRRGDVQDLARQLDLLFDSPQLLQRMRAAAGPRIMPVVDHVARLLGHYDEALALPAPEPEAVGREHLVHAFEQREAGFRELVRSEKWEDVVAEQNEIIKRLTGELEAARRPPGER